jgi:hypothetical protein
MVTTPVLSCVISNMAPRLAGDAADPTNERSLYSVFLHPAAISRKNPKLKKYFTVFMIVSFNNVFD